MAYQLDCSCVNFQVYIASPLGGCLCERCEEYTLFIFSAPQIKTLSRSVAQLCITLRLSIEAIDVWNGNMMGKYKNDRTTFSISLETQGCSCGYVWKLSNCLLPTPQCHVCFLDSVCLVCYTHLLTLPYGSYIKHLIRCGLFQNKLSSYEVFVHKEFIKLVFLIALKTTPMKLKKYCLSEKVNLSWNKRNL